MASKDETTATLTKLLIQSTETHARVRAIDERTRKHEILINGKDGDPGIAMQVDRLVQGEKYKARRLATMVALWSAVVSASIGSLSKFWFINK